MQPTTCFQSHATAMDGAAGKPCAASTKRFRFAKYDACSCCSMRDLEAIEARKQCEAKQRQRTEEEAKRERPEPATAGFFGRDRIPLGGHRRRSERVFALNHATGDIV